MSSVRIEPTKVNDISHCVSQISPCVPKKSLAAFPPFVILETSHSMISYKEAIASEILVIMANNQGPLVSGVFRNSIVWINGHFLGNEASGYLNFEYDIST